MSYLDALDPNYRLILCDVWGVVHDGVRLYAGAEERLRQWRQQGRCVILITNAPRTADAVEQQLARIGLPSDAYDFVATSGEAGIEALNALGRPVGFVGTAGPAAREDDTLPWLQDGEALLFRAGEIRPLPNDYGLHLLPMDLALDIEIRKEADKDDDKDAAD